MRTRVRIGRRGLMASMAAMLLTGCQGMAPDGAAEEMARQAYAHLVKKEDAALEAMLIPQARNPENSRTYDTMRSLIPPGQPTAVSRINWQAYTGTGGRRVTYQHLYDYGTRAVTATTVLVAPPAAGGTWRVQAFNVNVGASTKRRPVSGTRT